MRKTIYFACLWIASYGIHAQENIRVPNGIDFSRLSQINAQYDAKTDDEKPGANHRLKVFFVMKAIEEGNAHVLFPPHVGDGMGTSVQLRDRFKTAIGETNRFEFYDVNISGSAPGIAVEATITMANQTLEDFGAFLKNVTTVRMAVNIADLTTGNLLRSKNINAVYGNMPKTGTVVDSRDAVRLINGQCKEPTVCQAIKADYDKAIVVLMNNLAAFIEKSYRPVARVYNGDSDTATMLGGQAHGFNADEEVVIFRAIPATTDSGKQLPPIIKGVAIARCSVSDVNMNCSIEKKGKNGDVQKGDYAVPSNNMLKIKEE